MSKLVPTLLAALATTVLVTQAPDAQAAKNYGCFKVTAPSINIRARPYSSAAVIGMASKGDVLEKRFLFCTPRGFWCGIRKGSLSGYADKNFMTKVTCP